MPIPVQVLTPVDFGTLQAKGFVNNGNVENLLDMQVDSDSLVLLHFEKDKEKPVTKVIHTCREYLNSNIQEWNTEGTTAALSQESIYIHKCGLLKILQNALVSKNPFPGVVPLTVKDTDKLPATMLNQMISPGEEDQCNLHKSFNDCIILREGNLVQEDRKLRFTSPYDDVRYTPVLRGDINHDGYEDLAYFSAAYAKGGTYRRYEYICIDQKERGKFSIIDCFNGKWIR